METYEEAKRCAELFKSKADAIDGVIVTLPNFGDERAIADTLRLARLGVPILVQATPDTPSKMTITHRRDSFCGKMSACNNLMQYGIPYSLTTLHTETPDSAEFAKDLEWFAGVCRVVKGLRNLRIGALGARPTAFNTVRYSEKLLEASSISVETLDLGALKCLGASSRMKDTDEAAVQKLQSIRKYVTTTDIPQAALLKMAKLGVSDRSMDERHGPADQRRAVLDFPRGKPRRGAVHSDEHDERLAALKRLRSGRLRRARDARIATSFGNAQRTARLE